MHLFYGFDVIKLLEISHKHNLSLFSLIVQINNRLVLERRSQNTGVAK